VKTWRTYFPGYLDIRFDQFIGEEKEKRYYPWNQPKVSGPAASARDHKKQEVTKEKSEYHVSKGETPGKGDPDEREQ